MPLGFALLALGMLPALAAPARTDDVGPGPLPWRIGGPAGFTVDAAAFPDSAGHELEVYVRIPPSTLEALARDDDGTARLELTVQLRSAYGGRSQQTTRNLAIGAADSSGGFGKVVILHFPVRVGTQRLAVKLSDMLSRKRGLIYAGRHRVRSAHVEGEVEVPPAQADRDLSDIEFVWSEEAAPGESPFRHGDRRILPNPERLYGLLENDLRAFFVARARAADERPWHWVARVLNRNGEVVTQREASAAAARWLQGHLVLDLAREPAGGYDLEVKAWQEGDEGALLRRAHFSIAWQRESWLRNPRDIEDNVHFLLQPDEEERFGLMPPGEQERYLDDFWSRRDPTPETAENETRTTYLQRIAYANRTYGRFGLGKGMFSDMGRVYIRYGEPSDVLRQVIPAGDATLSQILAQINATEDREAGTVARRGLGGDIRPFEVWIYEGEIPAPPDADPGVAQIFRRRRLLFLFVDEQGLGDYRLRYSTE
ncbi:MAG: hypothetical protein A2V63_02525 [Candidatus Eisenbacteria bacterium RBG_19FT_COMBO_70_11]|nr:MAG: hypothetical protein A2V63_02525 [Candidatus Eisenbacteria bacterium RBG_19FT_COMBO_70_11]